MHFASVQDLHLLGARGIRRLVREVLPLQQRLVAPERLPWHVHACDRQATLRAALQYLQHLVATGAHAPLQLSQPRTAPRAAALVATPGQLGEAVAAAGDMGSAQGVAVGRSHRDRVSEACRTLMAAPGLLGPLMQAFDRTRVASAWGAAHAEAQVRTMAGTCMQRIAVARADTQCPKRSGHPQYARVVYTVQWTPTLHQGGLVWDRPGIQRMPHQRGQVQHQRPHQRGR
jgi:hypothetical protein